MSLFLWSLFSPPVDTHLCRKYRRIGLKNSRRLVLIHRRRKKKFAFFSALFFFLQPKLWNPTLCITSLNSALTHRWIFCHLLDPNCSVFLFPRPESDGGGWVCSLSDWYRPWRKMQPSTKPTNTKISCCCPPIELFSIFHQQSKHCQKEKKNPTRARFALQSSLGGVCS